MCISVNFYVNRSRGFSGAASPKVAFPICLFERPLQQFCTIVQTVMHWKEIILCSVHSSGENAVFVTTPRMNETTRHLAIKLVLNNESQVEINQTFEYRSNPVFTDIQPRNHLTV